MHRSNLLSLTWPARPRMDGQLNADAWPELSQTTQPKQFTRRGYQQTQCAFNVVHPVDNDDRSLDESEYPRLGESTGMYRHQSMVARTHTEDDRDTPVPGRMTMDTRKPGKRCRRTDKICINLQVALESTRCLKKINTKEPMKLKVNIYKSGQSTFGTKGSNRDENKSVNRIKISISKPKRPSKLKKIILLDRDARAQANIRKRTLFEAQKMEAIARDVNSIDFNALKITSEPSDTDYVKRMATLTVYGADYRDPREQEPVCHRPDVIEKLSSLRIQEKIIQQKYTSDGSQAIFRMCESIMEKDILRRATRLDLNDHVKQEPRDVPDVKTLTGHSRNFREYCTNIVNSGLNGSLDKFLCEIARLQKRHYEKDQNKGKYRRRYYSGLKEVRKHVDLRKVKFVIVAPDIEKVQSQGGLDDQVESLLDSCKRQNIVSCFGLRRRKLGFYTHGKGFVAAVGIANYNGTEEMFKKVLVELVNARNAYRKTYGEVATAVTPITDLVKLNLDSYLLSEQIKLLMKTLSPIG